MSKNRGKKGGQVRQTKKPGSTGASDKTFGMKNKKGKAAQKIVKAQTGGARRPTVKKKNDEEDILEAVNRTYASKPKNVQNANENKVEEKTKADTKANPFIDLRRDVDDEKDNMEDWDEAKLNEVVNKKINNKPTSNKECNYFMKAIEEKKYGYFWECPNGENCIYRHALPPDYVFKSEKKEVVVTKSLDEIIEERRAAINHETGVKVNETTFRAWKERKLREKEEKDAEAIEQRRKDIKAGRVKLNGREIFMQQMEEQRINLDEDEGDTLDILSLRKAKVDEEEQVDMENLRVISTLNATMAQEFADYVEPTEDELKKILNEGDNTIIITNNDSQVKVDTSLFDEDLDNIPDE